MPLGSRHLDKSAPADSYLVYLDKEMNIMGILSAFCVLTVAGIANAFKDVDPNGKTLASALLKASHEYIVAGCICMMAAALFFYGERSHLAWCYGQICLAQFDDETYSSPGYWLDLANGWSSWRSYKAAFAALGAGATEFLLGVLATKYCFLLRYKMAILLVPILIGAAYVASMYCVMQIYSSSNRPWKKFWQYMRFRLFAPKTLEALKEKRRR